MTNCSLENTLVLGRFWPLFYSIIGYQQAGILPPPDWDGRSILRYLYMYSRLP